MELNTAASSPNIVGCFDTPACEITNFQFRLERICLHQQRHVIKHPVVCSNYSIIVKYHRDVVSLRPFIDTITQIIRPFPMEINEFTSAWNKSLVDGIVTGLEIDTFQRKPFATHGIVGKC